MSAPSGPVPPATGLDEADRARSLLWAQDQAAALFAAVEAEGVIRPGVRDREASAAIVDLAAERFDVQKHWHKRIVRSGPHTLQPYHENPPDRVIGDDDIVFADFGPIFEAWEADFGRTWVVGDDPVKHRLVADLADVFAAGKAFFEATPEVTARDLYHHVVALSEERGWEYGNFHCGHMVGEFPHQNLDGTKNDSLMFDGNDQVLRCHDPSGRVAHWILEVHLVDRERAFGGFYEELLTL